MPTSKRVRKHVRIRMYRTGFGDCFLLTFGSGSRSQNVLIDFGVHMHGDIGAMETVMDDIERTTRKSIALVVASHAHRDHISGFGQFAERFSSFEIGEVWMPWTDNPKDEKALTLERKQHALYEALENHLLLAASSPNDPEYAAALNALSNLRGNDSAKQQLRGGFGVKAKVRYLKAGAALSVRGIDGLSAEVLGPPRDSSFFSRMDPPASQRYLTGAVDGEDIVRPFQDLEIRVGEEDFEAIKREGQPVVPPTELEILKQTAEAPAGRLALALDHVRNNTSLVILFRFAGKSLLFPGDAQWGSWQYWIDNDDAQLLLNEVDFLKVAHHGSENATPVGVVKALKASGLAVMVSTQIKPFPTIPRKPLLDALASHCLGHVAVRSDWVRIAGAPVDSKQKSKLPKGFNKNKIAIDYLL